MIEEGRHARPKPGTTGAAFRRIHPSQNVIRAQDDGYTTREFAERFISHGVAVNIVNQFKTIQIEHEDGGPLCFADITKAFI
jgi:hypothetical protein